MELLVHGCSHTYGDDLIDKSKSWPELVATKLSSNLTNLSASGASNERILRETLYATADSKPDLVIVAWAHFERFTRCRNDNRHTVDFNPHLKHNMYSKDSTYLDYAKLHFSYWNDIAYAFETWLQQIISLQSWLTLRQIPYIMLNGGDNYYDKFVCNRDVFNDNIRDLVCFDNINDEQLDQLHKKFQKLSSYIDKHNYMEIKNFSITKLTKYYPVGETLHLLEDGHKAVTDMVIEFVKHKHNK